MRPSGGLRGFRIGIGCPCVLLTSISRPRSVVERQHMSETIPLCPPGLDIALDLVERVPLGMPTLRRSSTT